METMGFLPRTYQGMMTQAHLGIVAKVALRYWRRLPPHVMAWFDLDDMIGTVMERLVASSGRYDPARAMPSTFVWTVAENCCRVVVSRHLLSKRYTLGVIRLDEITEPMWPDCYTRFVEARTGLEEILADASAGLRAAIEKFLLERRYRRWEPTLLVELRRLVRKHGQNYEDLRLALRGV